MPQILEYDIRVVGADRVRRELASLETRFAQFNARGGGRAGAAAAGAGAASVSHRRPGNEARELERAARAAQRAEQVAFRERQRAIDRQLSTQRALGVQRAREAAASSRALRIEQRERQRAVDRQSASQRSLARQRAREEAATLRSVRKVTSERARFIGSTIGNTGRRIAGAVGAVGRTGAAMIGLGGVALATSAAHDALALDERARRLSIQGRGPGEQGRDPEELRKSFTRIGIASGMAPEDVAGGAEAFVTKTGDVKTAIDNLQTFATVAQAAGASVEDIGSAAADLSTKMGISKVEDMQKALAMLISQGKRGAFELKNMAAEFPELLAAAQSAGVTGMGGVRQLGGFLQIARGSTGSAAETTTAVNTVFRQLSANALDLQSGKAFGGRKVQVFEGSKSKPGGDPTKPMRNFVDILSDTLAQSRGDLTKLQDIFDVRGIKAVNPLISTARAERERVLKSGGSEKDAAAAVRKAIAAQIEAAAGKDGDFKEVQRDAADVMKSPAIQMRNALTEIKAALAQELLPTIKQLAPHIRELAPEIAKLTRRFIEIASWLSQNPLKGAFAAVAATLIYEVTKAKIGEAITSAIAKATVGQAAGGALGGTAPAVGGRGALGALGLAGGLAIASLVVTKLLVDQMVNFGLEKDEEARARREKEVKEKADVIRDVVTGTIGMDEKQAREKFGEQGAQIVRARAAGGLSGADAQILLEEKAGTGTSLNTGGAPESRWRDAKLDIQRKIDRANIGPAADFTKRAPDLLVGNPLEPANKAANDVAFDIKELADASKRATLELRAIKVPGGDTPPRGNAPSPVKG